jgi:hypothetical protein
MFVQRTNSLFNISINRINYKLEGKVKLARFDGSRRTNREYPTDWHTPGLDKRAKEQLEGQVAPFARKIGEQMQKVGPVGGYPATAASMKEKGPVHAGPSRGADGF